MEFDTLFRLVVVMTLILILFRAFNIQGRESYLYTNKQLNIDLYLDMYKRIFLQIGLVIEINILYIMISVWMSLTFIHGHSSMRIQRLLCLFSRRKIAVELDEIQYAATTFWFVGAHVNFFQK